MVQLVIKFVKRVGQGMGGEGGEGGYCIQGLKYLLQLSPKLPSNSLSNKGLIRGHQQSR